MNIIIEEKEGKMILRFGEDFTIYEILDIQEEIVKALSEEIEVELDLSAVKECDTAGIQILLSLMKTAKARKRSVLIEKTSEIIRDTAICLGVDPEDAFKREEV